MDKDVGGNLLVIIGPTAVGKTALSLELAKELNGEIISGDSMQVYRGMDIGTAKATKLEREQVPHHLIDIKEPYESFSVAEFQELALKTIQEIQKRGKLPIVVGGTGLYVKALIYYPHYQFTPSEADPELRQKWTHFAAENGSEALWEEVRKIDPDAAMRLHPNDSRRLIRVLEIYETTGKPMSQVALMDEGNYSSPFQHFILGLTMPREQLYERINQRVDQMVAEGLVEEVASLLSSGIEPGVTAMQSLGYKEIIPYLEDRVSLEKTVELIKQRTRQFAKRQLTWFRKMDEIYWLDLSDVNADKNLEEIKQVLAGKFS